MGRFIGLDLSKHSAEVAVLHPGRSSVERSRFAAHPEAIRSFAEKLGPDDRVAFESCTNAVAFQRLLCQHAGQVVVSNPLKTRVIAEAKVKTDKVDAEIPRDCWPQTSFRPCGSPTPPRTTCGTSSSIGLAS